MSARPSFVAMMALACGSAMAEEPGAEGRLLTSSSMAWREVGPTNVSGFASVSIAPDDGGLVAAIQDDGRLWISTDGGFAWHAALDPIRGLGSRDEDALLDVETRMREMLDQLGVPEDAPPEAYGEDIGSIVAELQADVQGGFALRDEAIDVVGQREKDRPRVWVEADRRVVVARSDGLYDSADGGETWEHALTAPVRAWVAWPERRMEVAGGDEGMWVRSRSGAWKELTSAPSDVSVRDLSVFGQGIAAATSGGLWVSAELRQWDVWGDRQDRLLCVVADGEDGVWVGGPATVLHDREGALQGERRVDDVLRTSEGVLVAAGQAGVLASIDQGGTWLPVAGGWGNSEARAVAFHGDMLLVATSSGLLRLAEPEAAVTRSPDDWIPLATLLTAAERRVGMDAGRDRLGVAGQALVWLLPEIAIGGGWSWNDSLHSGLDAGLDGDDGGDMGLVVRVTWSPPRRNVLASAPVVYDDDEGINVYVGGTDDWMLLGRIDRRMSEHRNDVAEQISMAYSQRAQLVGELGQRRLGRTLRDEVNLRLRIDEIEAWLDALTDGAVHRYGAAGGGG